MAKYLPDMRAGDDYSLKLVVTAADGTPANIAGYVYTLKFKSSYDTTENALLFTTTAGSNANDSIANGICYIAVPASVTAGVTQGSYFYEVAQRVGTALTTVLPPVADYKDRIKVVPGL
jgi:hypothetical protein